MDSFERLFWFFLLVLRWESCLDDIKRVLWMNVWCYYWWLVDWLLSQTFCCFIRATLFMDLVWLFVLFRDYWKSRILMRILIARNPNWCLYNYLSFSFIFFSSLDFLFFLRCIQTLKVLLLLVSGFSAHQSENIDQSATFCVFWWVFDCSKVNLLRIDVYFGRRLQWRSLRLEF